MAAVSCTGCPKHPKNGGNCSSLCPQVAKQLPGVNDGMSGGGHWEQLLTSQDSNHPDEHTQYRWGGREKMIGQTRAALDSVRLPAPLREIAELYYWRGKTTMEIGAKLGIRHQKVSRCLKQIARICADT